MLKVMTIVGTRPEIIKMSRVISEFEKHTHHLLVHTGQNYDYELNQIFFNDLNIRRPDFFLEAVGANAIQTIARVIEKSDVIMEKEKPDAIMLYGDTNSCLAVIAAKRLKIPIFHMEAGNRCFDQRVPEELNRKVVDHLSDINLVLSEHARRHLLSEGIKPETIIKTGSHMGEVLDYYMPQIIKSKIINSLGLESNKFFVISIHREENVDNVENIKQIFESLNAIAQTYNLPLIVSLHPRTKKVIDRLALKNTNSCIQFCKPFGFFDYIKLQMESLCVLSDSGTIFEETSLLNLPSITLRNMHERPEGMDAGSLIMSGLKKESVLDAVKVIIDQHDKNKCVIQSVSDYNVFSVSKQILRIVMSYVGYVNSKTWFK